MAESDTSKLLGTRMSGPVDGKPTDRGQITVLEAGDQFTAPRGVTARTDIEPTQPSWLCENQLRPLERQLRQLKKKACLEDSDDDELREATPLQPARHRDVTP